MSIRTNTNTLNTHEHNKIFRCIQRIHLLQSNAHTTTTGGCVERRMVNKIGRKKKKEKRLRMNRVGRKTQRVIT